MSNILMCTGHELKIPDIINSDGIYVYDRKGKQYMDLESGVWCISIGHKNPIINDIIRRQIDQTVHAGFCYSSEILEESARSVLEITEFSGGKCVFLCSGSEGIEISRQIARHLTGKATSMTFHDSYLGSYSSVTNRSRDWYLFNWEKCRSCLKQDECDPVCGELQEIPTAISDFVFEPGSSSGFVRFPPKSLIRNIVQTIRKNGGKIIANEVTTGIGRTGKWFGFQHYDITPDMVAIGKGIGNGYPVSVAALNSEIVFELNEKPFKYAQSHQNDPLGAAVANGVIQFIKYNDLIREAERKGKVLFEKLQPLVDGKTVLAVRGRGMMVAVDISAAETTNAIYNHLLNNGFIIGNRGSSFRIDPSLVTTDEQISQFIDAFTNALAKYGTNTV